MKTVKTFLLVSNLTLWAHTANAMETVRNTLMPMTTEFINRSWQFLSSEPAHLAGTYIGAFLAANAVSDLPEYSSMSKKNFFKI